MNIISLTEVGTTSWLVRCPMTESVQEVLGNLIRWTNLNANTACSFFMTRAQRCQIEQAVIAFKFAHRIRLPDHFLDTLSHWTMNKPTRASLHQADNIRLPRAKKTVLQ